MGSRRRGAYSIEFALLMPPFVALMLGVVEYSWLSHQLNAVDQASAFGCRTGSLVDSGPDEVDLALAFDAAEDAMVEEMISHGPGCAECTTTVVAVGARPARSLRCRLELPYNALTGFVPVPETLVAEAVVRLEFQRSN